MSLPHALADRSLHHLLPRPQMVERTGEGLRLSPAVRAVIPPSPPLRRAAERLAALARDEFGLPIDVVEDARCSARTLWLAPAGEGHAPAAAAPPAEGTSEAYRLAVSEHGAAVTAPSERGAWWGAMTLWQLLIAHEGEVYLPGVRIDDEPHYAWRGFQFDAGRAPHSMAQMQRIIRICSAFKLNYCIYREGDDELNAVRYRGNPLGSRNPHALSLAQVAELVEYAAGYGVTLVPEIESLGHSGAKGRHYPDLVAGGIETQYEGIGTHRRKVHLLPGDPRALALLEGMYREWAPLLPSPYLHLGLDEVLMPAEPQAEHLARLLEVVERVGRETGRALRPIVWADAPPTPAAFRGRVVRCLWSYAEHRDYGAIGVENAHLVRQGIVELSRPGAQEPVLMAGGSGAKHTPYTKCTAPEAIENLAAWARWGRDLPHCMGLYAVQWSGNMVDDWLPDFLAAADVAWRPPEVSLDVDAELARIGERLARLKDYTDPAPGEVDSPAWDGIWLRDREWHEEVVPGDAY